MSKKMYAGILAILLLISIIPIGYAASNDAVDAANALYELGLFKGTGTDENGNPIYALDRAPTRYEAVTMLVRLLGKENEAVSGTWNTPFTDVTDWSKPYVGYAYAHGLTAGTSGTTYGGDNLTTVSQYLTFVLRALGYSSSTDFQWDKAWTLSDQIGITGGRYNDDTTNFIRGDAAIISFNALSCKLKNSNFTLVRKLYDDGAIRLYDTIQDVGLSNATGLEIIDTPKNLRTDTKNGKVYLVWDAPKQTVTSYDVYVSTEQNGPYTLFFTPSTAYVSLESSVIYTLESETTYYFKIRAIRWDIQEEQHYFSAFSTPISVNSAIAPTATKAPLETVSAINKYLTNAAQNEQNALYMCQAAMTASSSYYGKYYADLAQDYFSKIKSDTYNAVQLCGNYENLQDLKVPLATIYAINSYSANYTITNSNYLSYVIEASTYASELTVYYEEAISILQGIVQTYN